MWKTRVCDILGIEYPILEGGMSIAGNAELAAAISNAGGLGMLGSNPGCVPPEKREENLAQCIRTTKGLTDRPFGVNIPLYGMKELATRLLEVSFDLGVKVIACSGGNPSSLISKIKQAGAKAIHVVSNVKQAKQAQAAGVDIVVAEGYEAGGSNSPDELTTFVLVPSIADAVDLPVVAAGGISDARGFVAAVVLGAEGVQMGSRFIVTKECHAHENFKLAVLEATDTDTIVTRRALGGRIRSLKNDFTGCLAEMDRRGVVEEMKAFIGPGRAREGQLLGDRKNGEMSIGQNAGSIKEILTAADVIRCLIDGSEKVLYRCNSLCQGNR